MDIKISKEQNVLVFTFKAKIFGLEYPENVSEHVDKYLSRGERNFVFDLSQVKAINSIGVGLLMSSWTRITDAQGKLRLIGLNKKVREILSICETDQFIPISKNLSYALKYFN